jgi:hypothetical protein
MTDHDNRQSSDQLHPWIYRTIVVLALILVLSAWGFFGGGYSGLALSVVSAFIFIAVAIPVLLWRMWRKNSGRQTDRSRPMPFASWRSCDLEISEGRVKGVEAMVEVLLPIVAVAFGMAVLALVLHFDIGS